MKHENIEQPAHSIETLVLQGIAFVEAVGDLPTGDRVYAEFDRRNGMSSALDLDGVDNVALRVLEARDADRFRSIVALTLYRGGYDQSISDACILILRELRLPRRELFRETELRQEYECLYEAAADEVAKLEKRLEEVEKGNGALLARTVPPTPSVN